MRAAAGEVPEDEFSIEPGEEEGWIKLTGLEVDVGVDVGADEDFDEPVAKPKKPSNITTVSEFDDDVGSGGWGEISPGRPSSPPPRPVTPQVGLSFSSMLAASI